MKTNKSLFILNPKNVLVIITLLFAYRVFQSTPFEEIFFKLHSVFLGTILIFLFVYITSKLSRRKPFDNSILYFVLLIAFVPFYSAFRAFSEFGQPLVYGLLSERAWVNIGVGILLYHLIVVKKISFSILESNYILMAWFTLLAFVIITMSYDPGQLYNSSEVSKLVTYEEGSRGLRFKFQTYFITFGAIYYFIKYMTYKNPIDILSVFIFMSYIIFFSQSRVYIITMASLFLIYYTLNYSLSKFILNAIGLSIMLTLVYFLIQTLKPEFVANMNYLFTQMFMVATGEMSADYSANARINELIIVAEYFGEHPLSIFLGIGKISQHWNFGYSSIFGYFFPLDIGVFGGIFIYGLLGLFFLLVIPLKISFQAMSIVHKDSGVFINTIKYLLIYSVLKSIHGFHFFNIIVYVVPLFILLAYKHFQELEQKA